MLAVCDQSDFEDFEWLFMTANMSTFWKKEKYLKSWAHFILFSAKVQIKIFKRDFLEIFFGNSAEDRPWSFQDFDFKFSGKVFVYNMEIPYNFLWEIAKNDVTVSIWVFYQFWLISNCSLKIAQLSQKLFDLLEIYRGSREFSLE